MDLPRLTPQASGRAAALLGALVLCGCVVKDHSNAKDFVAMEMQGKINGSEWVFKHAYVDPTIDAPEEDDFVFVFLPYKPKTPCPKEEDEERRDKRSIMVSAPKVRKQTKLKRGTGRTLVFHFERKGEQFATAAKSGKVELTSIGTRTVKGRVLGRYNAGNWVNGSFTATVCDFAELRDDGR